MTMPPLPPAGDTNWRDDWAASVHDAAVQVKDGRLTDAALRAAFGTDVGDPQRAELDAAYASVLARAEYNPAGATVLSTLSTSSVDADAANLTVTFTAPADGAVEVLLEAPTDVGPDPAAAGTQALWSLRSGGADVPGTVRTATRQTNTTRISTTIRVTGLTPGQSYTYTWGNRTTNATYAARIVCGALFGPAVMRVGKD